MRSIYLEKTSVVENELGDFSGRIQEVQKDTDNEEIKSQFKSRRLMQGVYGQRQPDVHMIRIKVPGGILSNKQLNIMAEIAHKYSHGILHITTRQDIQIHYVKLENVDPILCMLSDVGLTTREACGNSIRNVSASPYTGLLRDQVFDVRPAVEEVTQFFLRNKDTQLLPRKFKIAFSENSKDYAVTGMHDLGAIATIKDGVHGFKVVVGGGLGAQPFSALVYNDFIEPQNLLSHFLAIARVYNDHGDRIKKTKARIKFLVHKKWDIDRFRQECLKELEKIRSEKIIIPTIPTPVPPKEDYDASNPFDPIANKRLHAWFEKNVLPTVKQDHYMIVVQIPLGDLEPTQVNQLCELFLKNSRDLGEDAHSVSVTDDQNLVIRDVCITPENKKEMFSKIYQALGAMGFGNIGAHDITDPISCPGTSTCNLGITHSKGLARAIRDVIEDSNFAMDSRFTGATIHMSGCPNSCGRHHISTLGFFGRSDKINEDMQAPAYGVLIGGGNVEDGQIILGKKCGKILARRIPHFIKSFIKYYEEHAQENENFVDFAYRIDKDKVIAIVETFAKENKVINVGEKINYDWGKDTPYVVEFGEGECAV